MLNEFKAFVMRGNVVDMAVGVIIGGAFGKIVASLVNDVIMPPIGMVIGNVDFSDLAIVLKPATETTKAVSVNYGVFINNVIHFLIIAFSIFIMVRAVSALNKKEQAAPADQKCPECLMSIPLEARRCGHCASAIPSR